MYVWVLEEGMESPEAVITSGYDLYQWAYWEVNSGPWEEQQMFLIIPNN